MLFLNSHFVAAALIIICTVTQVELEINKNVRGVCPTAGSEKFDKEIPRFGKCNGICTMEANGSATLTGECEVERSKCGHSAQV